jgi:hypothetical protein
VLFYFRSSPPRQRSTGDRPDAAGSIISTTHARGKLSRLVFTLVPTVPPHIDKSIRFPRFRVKGTS